MRRIRIIISGKVQGVYFRAFLKEAAESLGIKGWCTNCSEGMVEAVAEGDGDKIEKFLGEARKGPQAAEVRNIDIKEETYSGDLEGFEIRR